MDYRSIEFETIDAQYDVSASVPDAGAYRDGYGQRSSEARRQLRGTYDVAYGPTRVETLDFFPADAPRAPVFVFIHGGYWRRLSKEDFSFVAPVFVAAGVSVAVVEYGRAPRVSIDEIVRQNRAAIAWLYRNARSLSVDPARIHVAGHSAGGQIVGMLLATPWEQDYGLPDDLVKSACAISGVYDLEPLRYTRVNAWAQMDYETALRNSPIRHVPSRGVPLMVSYGGLETEAFKQQAEAYAAAYRARGHSCETILLETLNHFDIVHELARKDSRLAKAVLARLQQ